MKRRLLTILAALSPLLCVAVCVMWVRSYPSEAWGRTTYVVEDRSHRQHRLVSADGVLSLRLRRVNVDPSCAAVIERDRLAGRHADAWEHDRPSSTAPPPPSPGTFAQRLGFHAAAASGARSRAFPPGTEAVVRVGVPHWALAAATLALPLAWLRVARPRRHRCARHCPSCGYDLRATPERCPECGKVPPRTLACADAGDGAGGHVSQTEVSGRSPWQRRTPYRGS